MTTAEAEQIAVLSVVGARPNFMKLAPIHERLTSHPSFSSSVVHTGQHYDEEMNDVFFDQLNLPEPDAYLGVGSDTHGRQTAAIMVAFEEVLEKERPDLVIVVGDVNSTVACSLVAAKSGIPVAHVEAGLRSFDRDMPEEINRVLTDQLADHLFVTEEAGMYHLADEGVPRSRIHFVGNVMIDCLVYFREAAERRDTRASLGLSEEDYVTATFHRPSNVDHEASLREVTRTLTSLAEEWGVVFPVHPRTRKSLEAHGLWRRLDETDRIVVTEPLGYLDFLNLMAGSSLVVTDSGGIQEETTFLGVPCLTVRESTERPVTVEHGTNELVELDAGLIVDRARERARESGNEVATPPLWDGRAAERIVQVLEESFL